MMDSNINCPGCGVLLSEDNCGGYRCYCETCVEKIPDLPAAPAGTGFLLQGEYPDFYWIISTPATQLTADAELYDEDIPQ